MRGRSAGRTRSAGGAGPGTGYRHRARHGDIDGERRRGSWGGGPGRGYGACRPDRGGRQLRDRQCSAGRLRGARPAGASDRGPADDHPVTGRDRHGRLRARPVARARGRDRHRVRGRRRDDVRGIQCGDDAGLVRPGRSAARQSRGRLAAGARYRQPELWSRFEPADHPRFRRRPRTDSGGRNPHRRPVEPIGRPRDYDRSIRRRADRDRTRAGDAAVRVERRRRPRQHHHAARELPRFAVRRY